MDHVGGGSAHMFNGFLDRKRFLDEMYEANFMVGDIYETLALVAFGNLIVTVLHNSIKGSHGELLPLKVAMRDVTVAGVQLFCMSCLLQGAYMLVVTGVGFYFPNFHP